MEYVSKLTVLLNNNQQFGTSVNRDFGDVRRRVGLLKEIKTDWYPSLMKTHQVHNGFIPNYQTAAEIEAGHFSMYNGGDAAGAAITVHQQAESHSDWIQQCKYLNILNTGKIYNGLENFCTLETEGQGILESTSMFPGIITDFTFIVQIKGIYEIQDRLKIQMR